MVALPGSSTWTRERLEIEIRARRREYETLKRDRPMLVRRRREVLRRLRRAERRLARLDGTPADWIGRGDG